MRCTWSLVAPPYPTIACLTSLAVYWATSQPDWAATTRATPAACPVAMAVWALTWKNTRSTTTASGRNSSTSAANSWKRVPRRPGSGTTRVRGDHPAGRGGQSTRPAGHHAVAAARQARIDAQDEHAFDTSAGRPVTGTLDRMGDHPPAEGTPTGDYPSKAAITASGMSKLAKTFCTSS